MYQVIVFRDWPDASAEDQANAFLSEYPNAVQSVQTQWAYMTNSSDERVYDTVIILTVQTDAPLAWPLPRWCTKCGQLFSITTMDYEECPRCRKALAEMANESQRLGLY